MEIQDKTKHVGMAKLSRWKKVLTLFPVVGIIGLLFVWWQTYLIVQSVENSAQIHLNTGIQELNKVFIDKPHLWPYFEEGKIVSSEDQYRYEVLALTDMHINFIDSLWTQSDNIENLSSPTDEWSSWDSWIADLVQNAPMICIRFDNTQDWYTKSFAEYIQMHCSKRTASNS